LSNGSPKLYFVIPVLDEVGNLPSLFDSFRILQGQLGSRYDLSFILVDDGSRDGTGQAAVDLAGSLDLTVLTHPENRGPGSAFSTAFEHLSSRLTDHDWVATMEGDNTSRHELLSQMLTRAQEGYEVVLASPYMYGGGITNVATHRVMLSHLANGFAKEFLGCHGLVTVSSFFRLFQGVALRKLMDKYGNRIVESPGFECMLEMVIKMVHLRMTISEVPMVLDTSIRVGKSKMKLIRTIRGYLGLYRKSRRWLTD
jgi:dolichol-phosphate mannosyltransferase